ncbi:hypothetical protein N7466_010337 [Penicillium verhagenii]|uniref:uncharacterized protein n=1 Tax=Penicillium verhagenii TaxID=1562060 RepID=UPI002544FE18|nr:uncharacterized protein N7466_010337 [Penicillium verhagenii]KAJ5919394.1 hypothetical protein N7466_010337 [Penicillium verhagenii]
MHIVAFFSALLFLVQHVWPLPIESDSQSVLDVTLIQADNTQIKAIVKNVGKEEITFVHLNFFRDSAPVKKVSVYRDDAEVPFQGIKRHIKLQGLSADAITTLGIGEAMTDEFDIAATTDLTRGGSMTLHSSGLVHLVHDGTVSGHVPYRSNHLTIEVDAGKASQVVKAIQTLDRRTRMGCDNDTVKEQLDNALAKTSALAAAAAVAARNGSEFKFNEYFKTTDQSVREVVAARLDAVAREANSTTSATDYYCSDEFGYCESNVLAYTIPSRNAIANCDIYYSYLLELTSACHHQDRATTSLHEFTHAPGVFSPGTEDLGYGYAASTALQSREAVMNADTYALYANAVYLDC